VSEKSLSRSLVVVIKGREGIVAATADDEPKIVSFEPPHTHVVAAFFGTAGCGIATLQAQVAARLPNQRLPVREYARIVSSTLVPHGYNLTAVVAGYDPGASDGMVFVVETPNQPVPVEHHAGGVGMLWGGMREFVDRAIQGYDNRLYRHLNEHPESLHEVLADIPLSTMSLPACTELAGFLVSMTMELQRFSAGTQGADAVHVATVTAEAGVQRTQLLGHGAGSSR